MTEDIRKEQNPPSEKRRGASMRYFQSPTYRKWFQAGGDIDDFIFYEEQSGKSER